MMAEDLTGRRREVLEALRRLTARDGHPPTLREVADDVGLASPSSVLHHVRVLATEGHVELRPGRPRTIVER
jgi:repressor LexA